MTEFTLNKREEDFLKLNIGDKSFNIPLATSVTLAQASKMETMDGAIEFFRQYIPPEIADNLTLFNYRDIIHVWREASEKSMETGGVTPGES